MKMLMINSVCGILSTGKICTDLAQAYEQSGHEVKIAYGRDDLGMPECFSKYAVRIGTDFDVKVHGLYTRFLDKHGLASKRATKKFLQWVDEYKPDIIHLHNIHGYYINYELLFKYIKEHNVPVVWTLHDCWAITGHCTHFNSYGCEKWKSGCSDCPLKGLYPISKGFDNSKNNYIKKRCAFTGVKNLKIVTPSKWLGSVIKESYLKEYDIEVINNGIDKSIFKPTESELREKFNLTDMKIVLGVAKGWGPHKGLNYLKKLANDLPDDWKVVIIGLSEEQLSSFPKNMLGLAHTNNAQELAAWYTTADVFVNPTLEDTFPTTSLEAQACGTPVITFDSDGAAETVCEGNGIVVPRKDYDALLNEVLKIFDTCLTVNCDLVSDKKEFADNYLKLYKKVIKN